MGLGEFLGRAIFALVVVSVWRIGCAIWRLLVGERGQRMSADASGIFQQPPSALSTKTADWLPAP